MTQADIEDEPFVQRDFVLRVHRPVRRAAPVIQVLNKRLLVVVELVLPEVVAILRTNGEPLPSLRLSCWP